MDGTKLRCICLLFSCVLYLKSSVSLSVKTKFTLLTTRMTWNEAQQACRSIGHDLAKVDTDMKLMYITRYIATDWKTNAPGDMWIGLHEIDTDQPGTVQWSDCTTISFQAFAVGEPNVVPDDKLCFAMTGASKWIPYQCSANLHAICEKNLGDCTFDQYPQKGCSHSLVDDAELNWDMCTADCLTDTLVTGEECWAVGHWDGYSQSDCWKFYSLDDPDVCVNKMYDNSAINVGIKICFQSATNATRATMVQNTYPDTACFIVYTTTTELTTTDQTTTSTSTTTTQPGTTTTIPSTTTIPTTTTIPSTTTIPTTTTIPSTTAMPTTTRTTTELTVTTTTASSSTTTMPTTNSTSFPTIATCGCVCNIINMSLFDLKEEIKKLKVLLTVNKTSTSLYKRKFISVKDDRLSSVSIGYMGATLLVLTFGAIIALDFPVLVLHIKGLLFCSSNHRVSNI